MCTAKLVGEVLHTITKRKTKHLSFLHKNYSTFFMVKSKVLIYKFTIYSSSMFWHVKLVNSLTSLAVAYHFLKVKIEIKNKFRRLTIYSIVWMVKFDNINIKWLELGVWENFVFGSETRTKAASLFPVKSSFLENNHEHAFLHGKHPKSEKF